MKGLRKNIAIGISAIAFSAFSVATIENNDNETWTTWIEYANGYYSPSKRAFTIPPFKYEYIGNFDSRGIAIVRNKDGKYGYINSEDETIIPLIFDHAEMFSQNGTAAVELNGAWGYIDLNGDPAIPFIYKSASPFMENGLAVVQNSNGEYFLIDNAGKPVSSQTFKWLYKFSSNGLADVEDVKTGKTGFIDKNGKVVIPFQFDAAQDFSEIGLAAVKIGNLWGYINSEGEMIISPKYQVAHDFSDEGYAVVKVGDKFGYIDTEGKFLIPPTFSHRPYDFTPLGTALVWFSDLKKYGYINRNGEKLPIGTFENAKRFDETGLAVVKKGLYYGVINIHGDTVIPFKYFYIYHRIDDVIEAENLNGINYFDKDGNLLFVESRECAFDIIKSSNDEIVAERRYVDKSDTTTLFGVDLICSERSALTSAIKKSGGRFTKQDAINWQDTFDAKYLLEGADSLTVSYTQDFEDLASLLYVFPSRMNAEQVVEIKDMLLQKYGEPKYQSGNPSVGEVSYNWQTEDGFNLKVWRGWPNTTTYLLYEHLKNQKKRKVEFWVKERAEGIKRDSYQKRNF